MRLSLLILLLAMPAGVAAAPPAGKPSARCPSDRVVQAGDKQGARAKRLGELPPGKLYLTVDRKVAGCREPVIVRYGIGAAAPARPKGK